MNSYIYTYVFVRFPSSIFHVCTLPPHHNTKHTSNQNTFEQISATNFPISEYCCVLRESETHAHTHIYIYIHMDNVLWGNNLKADATQLLHESRCHRGSSVETLRTVHQDVLAGFQRLLHKRQGPLKIWIALFGASRIHIYNLACRRIAGVCKDISRPHAVHYQSNAAVLPPPTLINHFVFMCQYEAASCKALWPTNTSRLKCR